MSPLFIGAIVATICLVSLAVIVWTAWTAEEGYEDETGYHSGEPDE